MFELNLPRDIVSLEIGVRRRVEVIQHDCIVGLRIPEIQQGYEFPGWPTYSKIGYPAKFVPIGKENEVHKFPTIKSPAIKGQLIQLTILPKEHSQVPISEIVILGRTDGTHRYIWNFEVSND